MILDGTYRFAAAPDVVFPLLLDPEVLKASLPGVQTLTRTEEHRYEGTMRVGVGAIAAADFQMVVALTEVDPPRRYVMQIEGKGRFGFTRGTAEVALSPDDGGGCEMRYRADVQVGGTIAGVGQRLLDSVSRQMARQSLEAVSREIERRLKDGAP
jgi:carbon monoxide dehydrogenase subunit G